MLENQNQHKKVGATQRGLMGIDMMNIMLVRGTHVLLQSCILSPWMWPKPSVNKLPAKPQRNAAERPAEKSQHGAAKKKKRNKQWQNENLGMWLPW